RSLAVQRIDQHSGWLRWLNGTRGSCRCPARSSSTAAGPATCATTAATGLRRPTGDRHVLFAIDHERHGRTHLRKTSGDIHELVAVIGTIHDEPGVDTREYQIAGSRECSALVKARR